MRERAKDAGDVPVRRRVAIGVVGEVDRRPIQAGVGVDQPWQDGPPCQVDDPGPLPGRRQLGSRTDGGNPAAIDQDGPGDGVGLVHRADEPVGQEERGRIGSIGHHGLVGVAGAVRRGSATAS